MEGVTRYSPRFPKSRTGLAVVRQTIIRLPVASGGTFSGWDTGPSFEDYTDGGDAGAPAVWDFERGVYTMRFHHRENGVSVDKWILQKSNLPAPSGDGGVESRKGGTITFAPGETSKTVSVEVIGDGNIEPDEQFLVELADAKGATLADNSAVGTILNDDHISINDVTIPEETGGTVAARFAVSLSEPFSNTVVRLCDGRRGGVSRCHSRQGLSSQKWHTRF